MFLHDLLLAHIFIFHASKDAWLFCCRKDGVGRKDTNQYIVKIPFNGYRIIQILIDFYSMKKIILLLLLLPIILSLKAQNTNQLRYGFINQKGELVAPIKYKKVGDFNDGYAIVQNESNELLIINKQGIETPIKNKNYVEGFGENRYAFNGGLCAVLMKDKLGYINSNGEDVIPCTIIIDTTIYRYEYSLPIIVNNMIVMADGNGSFKFLDKLGNKIKQFESLPPIVTIQNNVFMFGTKEKYGLIDVTGKEIVKPEYTRLSINDKNIIIAKHLESGSSTNYYCLLNYKGIEIPNTRCNYISFFENGIALYKSTDEKNQWGIMDYKGNRTPFKENYQFKDNFKYSDREEIRAYFNNGYIVAQNSEGKDVILDAKGNRQATKCSYNFNRIKTISSAGIVLDYNAEKKYFTLFNLKTCKIVYDNIPEKYNSVFDLVSKSGNTIIKLPIQEGEKFLKFMIVDQFGNITFSQNENKSRTGGIVLNRSNTPNIYRLFSELIPKYINADGKFLSYCIIGRDFKDGMSAVIK